jgi:hypothetical protein
MGLTNKDDQMRRWQEYFEDILNSTVTVMIPKHQLQRYVIKKRGGGRKEKKGKKKSNGKTIKYRQN